MNKTHSVILSNSEVSQNRVMNVSMTGCIESYTSMHQDIYSSQQHRKTAFTLAEVLVTLGVIGIVAAIIMPMLITNINDLANSERHANIAYKITQAMEQMRAHGKLTAYPTTSAFVDELQKYLKITKRCDANHIAQCWPTEKVTTASGEEYNVADCKQRKNLLAGSDSEDENVGLILADGASIILTYDTDSPNVIDIGDRITADTNYKLPVGNGKWKSFAYTTSVTGGIDFVTDVNGKKGPNSEMKNGKYNDIRKFRLASFVVPQVSNLTPQEFCDSVSGEYHESAGCIKFVSDWRGWAPVNCSDSGNIDYKYCGDNSSGLSEDYWAGANKICSEAGMKIADLDTLNKLYNNLSEYQQAQQTKNMGYAISSSATNENVYTVSFYSGYNGYLSRVATGEEILFCIPN